MIVLAVDAATDRLSVAAGRPGGVVVSRVAEGARRHAGLLVPYAGLVLAELGLGLDQVEALVVSDGPGSFTGLRVAAAWAKGLAAVRRLPLWTASSLLVRAAAGPAGGLVLGVGSALRGEWYVGGYELEPDGAVTTVLPPSVLSPSSPPPGRPPIAVIGDQAAGAVAVWAGGGRVVGPPAGLPDAAALIGLIGRPGGAILVGDAANWEPSYGRPAEAQAKWEREHGRALPDPTGHSC